MSSVSGRPRTKELYDAFGEVSDDDADEETGLRGAIDRTEGLGFHSGFLDDDPSTAGGMTPAAARYKDEPGSPHEAAGPSREHAPSPEGSGDGSWEHASETR